ncbi:MAG: hypothetical protein CHACPFDD_03286 [Phycisphaerae bacterium]|nr:hypothetical protein [Phycisphaerae bacterium]
MFARGISSKVQAAQSALADGRIDDAYRVAIDPALRGDRRLDALRDDLARPLLARARLHAQAGRYREAMEDLDRLGALSRESPDARELRQVVMNMLTEQQGRRARREDAFEKAAARLRAGQLDSVRVALDEVPADDDRRAALASELDLRMRRSDQLIEQARAALKKSDVSAALRFWEEARSRHGRTASTESFASELVSAYRTALERWFVEGRLDRFVGLVAAGGALHAMDATLREYRTLAELVGQAGRDLAGVQFGALRECLARLNSVGRRAGWLSDAQKAVAAAAQAQESLLASALGLVVPLEKTPAIGMPPAAARGDDTVRVAAFGAGGDAREAGDAPMLLLVDGTGSSVLHRRDLVRIGRAGGEESIDVPIPADLQSHHADIVRHGEDYFLAALGPTTVNGRRATRVLLRDGDRITLGSAKLTFRKPSERSETAVLTFGDRYRLPQDVDRVVLLRDTCLIGPDASCHIRTREGDSRLVLFVRDGQYSVRLRPQNGGDRPQEARPLPMGATSEFGDVRLTLKAYDVRWRPEHA